MFARYLSSSVRSIDVAALQQELISDFGDVLVGTTTEEVNENAAAIFAHVDILQSDWEVGVYSDMLEDDDSLMSILTDAATDTATV
jgi:hypothetical protein